MMFPQTQQKPESPFVRLGKRWVQAGWIPEETLRRLLQETDIPEEQLRYIQEFGNIPEQELLQDIAEYLGCPYWNYEDLWERASTSLYLFSSVNQQTLLQHTVVPVQLEDDCLQIAMASWPSASLFSTIQAEIPARSIVFGFATRENIQQLIGRMYGRKSSSSRNKAKELESWDDWSSSPVQSPPTSSTSPQPRSSKDVDHLLSTFLTPDEELPAHSSSPSMSNIRPAGAASSKTSMSRMDGVPRSGPSPASSAPSVEISHPQRQEASGSSSVLAQAEPSRYTGPKGLDSLKQIEALPFPSHTKLPSSSGSSPNHRGVLGSSANNPASSGLSQENLAASGSRNALMAAELEEVKQAVQQDKQKQHKKRLDVKQDARNAEIMSWFFVVLKILALLGVIYLVYQGWKNGI